MPNVLYLALLALAVAWTVWLVVDAAITLPLRFWVMNRFGENSKITYLVHCRWCSAVWVSAPMTAITYLTQQHPIWLGILTFMAMALIAPTTLALIDRTGSG